MAKPEFPRRKFTLDDEHFLGKSVDVCSCSKKLFKALYKALQKHELEEIKQSSLGVLLKLCDLSFGWASRLVHHMLSFQLVCESKYEIWSVIGVTPIRFSLLEFEQIMGLNCDYIQNLESPDVEVDDELKQFWERMGVGIEAGPSQVQIIQACGRCKDWERIDRIRLGYLALFCGFIEAQSRKAPTRATLARLVMDLDAFQAYPWGRVAFKFLIESVKQKDIRTTFGIEGFSQVLQCWIYIALPDFAAKFVGPIPNNPTPFLLAHKGSRGRKHVKVAMRKPGSRIVSCVLKPFGEMFPRWDDDHVNVKVENIAKALGGQLQKGKRPWKWDISHWPVEGVLPSNNPKPIVVEDVKDVNQTAAAPTSNEVVLAIETLKAELKADIEAGFASIKASLDISSVDIGLKIDFLNDEVAKLKEKFMKTRTAGPGKGNEMVDNEKNTQDEEAKKEKHRKAEEDEEKEEEDEEEKKEDKKKDEAKEDQEEDDETEKEEDEKEKEEDNGKEGEDQREEDEDREKKKKKGKKNGEEAPVQRIQDEGSLREMNIDPPEVPRKRRGTRKAIKKKNPTEDVHNAHGETAADAVSLDPSLAKINDDDKADDKSEEEDVDDDNVGPKRRKLSQRIQVFVSQNSLEVPN